MYPALQKQRIDIVYKLSLGIRHHGYLTKFGTIRTAKVRLDITLWCESFAVHLEPAILRNALPGQGDRGLDRTLRSGCDSGILRGRWRVRPRTRHEAKTKH